MLKTDPRVALFAASTSNKGGTGVYTERLIRGFQLLGMSTVEPIGERAPGLAAKLWSEHMAIPAYVRSRGFDLQHLPAFGGKPVRFLPYAVTIHDMAFMACPSWFPTLRSIYYRLHFPGIARRASMIITDSDFSASEIRKFLGIHAHRVYLSAPENNASQELFRHTYGIQGRYVLFTGTVEPRKNLGSLIKAWHGIRAVHSDLTLVVAGRWGWGDKKIRSRLMSTKGIRWLGSIPGDHLDSANAGAVLAIYPSVYEGFGLPPLEAAAAGTPFVIGPAEALREIYQDSAAGITGESHESITDAVLNALDRKHCSDSLKAFASEFSLEKTAMETMKCYRSVVGR